MTTTATYRPEIPRPMPDRIRRLPVHRGYPVPWFVPWVDGEDEVPVGQGIADFRMMRPGAIAQAHNRKLCWICGGSLGSYKAFVAGPMCAVNRNSAEPPSHTDCADWSARACPFLTRPHAKRREIKEVEPDRPAGIPIMRNPGVALVWICRSYTARRDPITGGALFRFGDPSEVRWYAEGREATRAEIEHSIDTGLPKLREAAELDGPAGVRALERCLKETRELLPGA